MFAAVRSAVAIGNHGLVSPYGAQWVCSTVAP